MWLVGERRIDACCLTGFLDQLKYLKYLADSQPVGCTRRSLATNNHKLGQGASERWDAQLFHLTAHPSRSVARNLALSTLHNSSAAHAAVGSMLYCGFHCSHHHSGFAASCNLQSGAASPTTSRLDIFDDTHGTYQLGPQQVVLLQTPRSGTKAALSCRAALASRVPFAESILPEIAKIPAHTLISGRALAPHIAVPRTIAESIHS